MAERPSTTQPPSLATIAIVGFVIGVIVWVGGACVILGSGGEESSGGPSVSPGQVGAPGAPQAVPTPTRLPDRTSCAEIRGSDYRSEVERQFFLQNCNAPP